MSTTFYKRIFARIHAHNINRYNKYVDKEKLSLFSDLHGQVLEIGAGTGINIQYFPTDIDYIALEPNIEMHKYLNAEISRKKFNSANISPAKAELLPFEKRKFDVVISTLVLCSVTNTDLVLQEIQRVLKPGGRFIFIEHIAAPHNILLRKIQHLLKIPWKIVADGCNLEMDTAELIRSAKFDALQIKITNLPIFPLVSPHIFGTASIK